MALLKSTLVLIAAVVVLAEPQQPGNNQYLPPDPKGYNYPTPQVPFHTPSTRPPSTGTYNPPPSQTSYRPSSNIPPTQPPYHPPSTGHFNPPPRPPTGGGGNINLPTPTYGVPTNQHEHHEHGPGHVHEPGMPFDFNYAVKDANYGTDYSHNAVSDGDVVKGEYRVQLPDGRMQIVRYTADWATGFHADVSYEGQARYPDTPSGNYGSPSGGRPGGGRPGGGY